MSDDYRIVTARFMSCTPRAIFVRKASATRDVSIPRSLIHGADDWQFDKMRARKEVTFRLREWKAEELGLA